MSNTIEGGRKFITLPATILFGLGLAACTSHQTSASNEAKTVREIWNGSTVNLSIDSQGTAKVVVEGGGHSLSITDITCRAGTVEGTMNLPGSSSSPAENATLSYTSAADSNGASDFEPCDQNTLSPAAQQQPHLLINGFISAALAQSNH